MRFSNVLRFGVLFAGVSVGLAGAQAQVPTPVSVLGHTPGDDFYLATTKTRSSTSMRWPRPRDRMKMFTVGKTTQGRDIEVGVISSPENLAQLDEYKKNARRLATAEDLNDEQAHELARDIEGDRAYRWRAALVRGGGRAALDRAGVQAAFGEERS